MDYLLIGVNAKYIHTNLAIRYLYTYTQDKYDVDFMEFTIKDSNDNILQTIFEANPTLIGFSCYIWNIEKIIDLIKQIKALQPHINILLGGPEVSYEPTHFLNHYPVDYIIVGEGEYAFHDLLDALHNNLSLDDIPQLYYKQDETIHFNTKEYTVDFNQLPSPYRL